MPHSPYNPRPKRDIIEQHYQEKYIPLICRLYHTEMMSGYEISEKFLAECGAVMSPRSIQRMVEKYSHQPLRTIKEAFNIAVKKGRMSWEHQRNYLKVKQKKLKAGLRFAILSRDNFTCKACGLRAEDGGVLEVDHVVPIKDGGTNAVENLQTLCRDCNMGKNHSQTLV